MIRKARKSDFEAVYPILNQIFDEMDMDTINRLPESQFYDLIRLGFISENYRYSYNRIWVETDENDRVRGMICMYPDKAQGIIDVVLRKEMAKVGLPMTTDIFTDKEAQKGEWYIDALAVSPRDWGKGIASRLMELAPKLAKKHGYKKVSLNVDLENPRAQQLYLRKGFKTTNSMTIGDRVYDHMVKEV
ncbi:GNAT family N-acetyltransferase [Lactobacillus delbrueckii subsp. allosunkii]|uniref:GNAT family N-acetyltransferase n=1 Tax=Lactobacillus delbrueckii subsp. allosunkii TaxID=1050107 RepID=A0ABD4SAR7_9LACO|nr:GNAT family N-acetyltransferase [Lactobacillus delbrueckii]MCD5517101.1 GNAT family N-acetyltransferase [Lactobacillus delbrueckii subsp. sunkii]MCT3476588.1 N-acetyltransferase [Lactobacillus delbrueckii subsp. lactis]MCZ0777258.1 GNAT family N-acetyltransferase [Lactobacillus delbrueckii subsp. sunkii]MCZ0787424.1 GNAT family N-acetyltransferase [Lactobacillus delbrueckii subsp. sunkii]MCZ0794544.1 GNAT family N-acetyltransferase [Lactobacillus delbrueckii]